VKKRSRIWLRALELLLAIVGIGTAVALLPIKQALADFLEWARDHQFLGAVLLALIYALATVVAIPGSLLTLGAGFAFGLGTGFVAVFFGANLGASAAFLLGRTLARDWIAQKVAANPKFQAIDRAVGAQGFKMVLLLRLSPVFPFNILNYALGLTSVSFRAYLLATLLGMLPGTLMYVYLGTLAQSVADLFSGRSQRGPAEQILFYAGLAATVLITLWITWIARKALAASVPAAGAENHELPQREVHG
jgi:uncharacterized membrane protein YdjX (TVP38/TMEM64 family)